MLNTAVKVEFVSRDDPEDADIRLKIASDVAYLHVIASSLGADSTPVPRGLFGLPVDPLLGKNDPNLCVLRAMQVAGEAEIDRLRRGAAAQGVHVPLSLDLADLRRFPSSGSRK